MCPLIVPLPGRRELPDIDERMRPTAQKDVVGSLRRGPATAMLPSSVTEVAIPES